MVSDRYVFYFQLNFYENWKKVNMVIINLTNSAQKRVLVKWQGQKNLYCDRSIRGSYLFFLLPYYKYIFFYHLNFYQNWIEWTIIFNNQKIFAIFLFWPKFSNRLVWKRGILLWLPLIPRPLEHEISDMTQMEGLSKSYPKVIILF